MIREIFYEAISNFGLIGPHAGVEEELLACGAKPVGMFCIPDIQPHEVTGENPWIPISKSVENLDELVQAGKLKKEAIEIPPLKHWMNRGGVAHFYCHPTKLEDMKKAMAFHDHIWRRDDDPPFSMNIGQIFGYTEADVRLFQSGGYRARNPVMRALLSSTHDMRKSLRIITLKRCAKLVADYNQPEPPQT